MACWTLTFHTYASCFSADLISLVSIRSFTGMSTCSSSSDVGGCQVTNRAQKVAGTPSTTLSCQCGVHIIWKAGCGLLTPSTSWFERPKVTLSLTQELYHTFERSTLLLGSTATQTSSNLISRAMRIDKSGSKGGKMLTGWYNRVANTILGTATRSMSKAFHPPVVLQS